MRTGDGRWESVDGLETGETEQELLLTEVVEPDMGLGVLAAAFDEDDFAAAEAFVNDVLADAEVVVGIGLGAVGG